MRIAKRLPQRCCAIVAVLMLAHGASTQGPDLSAELHAAFNQGAALFKKGKNAEAILFFEKALALALKVFGPDHLDTAVIMRTTGTAYANIGRFAEAERHFRRCLEIREAKLP